jgi:hypothetical protein
MKEACSESEWTHKALVQRLARWMKSRQGATVVMTELATRNSETPDVIGWASGARSTLIECKRSRADFLADGKKWFRRRMEEGMGELRYVAAPKGLLRADEMPEGWGLLEVEPYRIIMTKEAVPMKAHKTRECVMLMSALRRLELSTAVYVVHDDDIENKTLPVSSEQQKEGEQ